MDTNSGKIELKRPYFELLDLLFLGLDFARVLLPFGVQQLFALNSQFFNAKFVSLKTSSMY